MSTQINPGLNIKAKVSLYFHEMMENQLRDLDSESRHTDMVLVCPQEGKSLRVSQFSASIFCFAS